MNSRDDRDIEILLAELRWNPYSDSTSTIEVKWVARPVQPQTTLLEFRARLIVIKGDAQPVPQHAILEPPVSVLLMPDGVRFIGSATAGWCHERHTLANTRDQALLHHRCPNTDQDEQR